MRETVLVNVMQTKEHLLEVVAADVFAEGTTIRNVVEELSSSYCFLCDVGDWDLLAVFVPGGRFLEFVVFDDVFVLKFLGCFNFFLKEIDSFLVIPWVGQVEDLEGELLVVFISSELDLGAETRAECLLNVISVEGACGLHFSTSFV